MKNTSHATMDESPDAEGSVSESVTGSVSTAASKRAGWRWGVFVTAFLVAQLGLAYAAVKAANSDGGAAPIPGAEEEVAKSFDDVRAEERKASAKQSEEDAG